MQSNGEVLGNELCSPVKKCNVNHHDGDPCMQKGHFKSEKIASSLHSATTRIIKCVNAYLRRALSVINKLFYVIPAGMASQLDESVSSSRDSVIYDDITLGSNSGKEDAPEKNCDSKKYITSATKNGLESEESLKQCAKRNLCQRSDDDEISVEEDDQGKKMKEGNGPFIEEAVHNLHQEYKDDKELLTPVKTDEDSKLSHAVRDSKDLLYSQPIKPPRRHSQKKTNLKEKSKTENGESDLENLMESDTVTTERTCLAPKPKPWAISEIKTDAGSMENEPLPLRDHREEPTEIVCKPVRTSSPNQDETPSLSVEAVDTLDTSRRVLSYLEASPEGGKGARKRVESFYDFLYSKEGVNSVVNVTLPSVQDSGRVGSQPTFSEEHAYDEVPLENSISESFGKKSILGSTYEEVIVNQGSGVVITIMMMMVVVMPMKKAAVNRNWDHPL